MDEQLTIKEAARELSMHREHVRRLLRTRALEGAKLGRDWYVSKASVDAYKTGGRTGRLKLACEWAAIVPRDKASELERLIKKTFPITENEIIDLMRAWKQKLVVAVPKKEPAHGQ